METSRHKASMTASISVSVVEEEVVPAVVLEVRVATACVNVGDGPVGCSKRRKRSRNKTSADGAGNCADFGSFIDASFLLDAWSVVPATLTATRPSFKRISSKGSSLLVVLSTLFVESSLLLALPPSSS